MTVPFIVGIDPGTSGAICFLDVATEHPAAVFDMPIFELAKARGGIKSEIDVLSLRSVLQQRPIRHVWLERVHNLPLQGGVSAFNFGESFGAIKACLSLMGVAHSFVEPATWKKAMGAPANKSGARQRASQLMPDSSLLWLQSGSDGKAEAAMIALYGFRTTNGVGFA